jgi:hypothetical protein
MQTILTSYYFDTRNPEEATAYKELAARLLETNGKCFETHGNGSHYNAAWLDGVPVTLETAHLFNNQWNTAPGGVAGNRRVFDWAQDYPINFSQHIKRGHYLEITPEMQAARDHTVTCGYCGHQEPDTAAASFCPKCIGSEYLEEKNLPLTRLQPVSSKAARQPLTDGEAAILIPRWREAQGLGKRAREGAALSKRRQNIAQLIPKAEAKAAVDIEAARTETAALTWLMDAGYRDIENVIYYTHTGRFGFGWRKPLDAAEHSALLDILGAEFPFDYDIKRS